MRSKIFFSVVLFAAILSSMIGCNYVNKNPDILSQYPYNQVQYVAQPKAIDETIDVVQVTTRGLKANILNTIPELYKKVLEKHHVSEQPVRIHNISITSFTQKESFQVPYQHCTSRTSYSSGKPVITQHCTTLYRTEIRNVLYQKATADIIKMREKN